MGMMRVKVEFPAIGWEDELVRITRSWSCRSRAGASSARVTADGSWPPLVAPCERDKEERERSPVAERGGDSPDRGSRDRGTSERAARRSRRGGQTDDRLAGSPRNRDRCERAENPSTRGGGEVSPG